MMNKKLFQDVENRTIFINDNLNVMQKMDDKVVDLIYLDPPFGNMLTWKASNREKIDEIKNYFLKYQKEKNLFPEENFEEIFRNVEFDDTWKETDVNMSWQENIIDYDERLFTFIDGIDFVIKGGKHYLFYMAIRLIEMKRILKNTGSIYLHCDNTMGHYLKSIMDIIFGYKNFRNEIVWSYTGNSIPKNCYPKKHDLLFFYSKTKKINYYPERILQPYSELTEKRYNHIDEEGKRYKISALKAGKQEIIYMKKGKYCDDVFTIPTERGKKSLGYPTQKPLALLERIIKASSNEGDVVLDPFCGCATTLIAAETLNRKWIGIDKNQQAFYMNYYRMRNKLERIVESKDLQENLFGDSAEKLKEKKDVSGVLINYFQAYRKDLPTLADVKRNHKINQEIADREKIDEEYRRELEEEAKVLKGSEKAEFRDKLRMKQNNTCKICKTKLYDAFHLDRIMSGSQGGQYLENNLQILCTSCNLSKNKNTNIHLIKKLFKKKKIDEDVYRLNVCRECDDGRINKDEKEDLLKALDKRFSISDINLN